MKPIDISLNWDGNRGTYYDAGREAVIDKFHVLFDLSVVANGVGYVGDFHNAPHWTETSVEVEVDIIDVVDEAGEVMETTADDISYLVYNIKSQINYE